MKRIFLALMLLLACSISTLATDITVASTTVPNWIGPTSGIELRGFLSSTLTVPSGTPLAFTANSTTDLLTAAGHTLVVGNAIYLSIGTAGVLPTGLTEGTRYYVISVSGNDLGISTTAGGAAINFTSNGSGTIYILTSTTSYPASSPTTGVTSWRYTCTVSSSVVGGLTIYTLTIPAITIPATTNAVSGYGARWSFYFYRSSGSSFVRLSEWYGYNNLRVPTSAASTTWDAIKIYNNDTIATADSSTYTKTEIDALLISCCSGGGGGGSGYSRIQEEGTDLTQRTTLNFAGAGFTAADDSTRTTVTLDADLSALAGLSGTGFISRTGTNTYALRTITGSADQIGVSFGSGAGGDVLLYIPDVLRIGVDGTGGVLSLVGPGSPFAISFSGTPSSNYSYTLPTGLPGTSSCLKISATGQWSYDSACGGGGSGAPNNATYFVLGTNGTLTDERRWIEGTGLVAVDSGAGADFTVSIDQAAALTWTALETFKVSATVPGDAISLSIDARTTDGVRNSHNIVWRGWDRTSSVNTSHDWRGFVTVAAAASSAFTFTSRTNAGAYATRFQIDNSGNIYVLGLIQAGSGGINLTNATGNLQVSAFAAASLSGNATKLATTTGTLTAGRCVEIDADGNFVEDAGACGGGSPAGSTGDYQINSAGSLAAGQLKDLAAGRVSITDGASGGGTIRAIPLTPAQITADQTNYTLAGHSFNLRLSTDARRTIRGITFSGNTQVDGQVHLIHNIGTQPIDFTHEDAAATSTNRFKTASGRTTTVLGDRSALVAYDNTSARWRLSPLAVNPPETLVTNTAIKSVTNTTTETSLLNATFTTQANFWTVGKTLVVRISGIMGTAVSAPTLRIKLKGGSTVVVDSTAVTTTTLNGNTHSFTAEITLMCQSVGASGAFDGVGQWRYNTAANGLSSIEMATQAATLDTTGTIAFDVTAQWGTANVQNTISVISAVATAY